MTRNESKLEQAKFVLKQVKRGIHEDLKLFGIQEITSEDLEYYADILCDTEERVSFFEDKLEEEKEHANCGKKDKREINQ